MRACPSSLREIYPENTSLSTAKKEDGNGSYWSVGSKLESRHRCYWASEC